MTAPVFYRQGDVLIIRKDSVPSLAPKNIEGPVILAYGEVTGHTHRFENRRAVDMIEDGMRRFLAVHEAADLTHEEHATITVPPGNYEVIIQSEYSPQGLRNVAD